MFALAEVLTDEGDTVTGRMVFGFIFRDAHAAIPTGTKRGTELSGVFRLQASEPVAVKGTDTGTRTDKESDSRLNGELFSALLLFILLPAPDKEWKSSASQGSDMARGL